MYILLFSQKEEISSGKVIELICVVKRKDNRTYRKFLKVLEEKQCTAAASLLKRKTSAEGMSVCAMVQMSSPQPTASFQ